MSSSAPPETSNVLLIDDVARWARRPANAVRGIIALIGIAFLLLLSRYGHTTTVAVTHDVAHAAPDLLSSVLSLPINILEGTIGVLLPLVLLGDLIRSQRWRALATSIGAVASAMAISYAAVWLMEKYLPSARLTQDISGSFHEQVSTGIIPYVSVLAALLSIAGAGRRNRRLITASWWLLGVVLVLSILQGNQTLIGSLITVLVGSACGYFGLYIVGDSPNRAMREDIVLLVRQAGIDCTRIIRLDAPSGSQIRAWDVKVEGDIGQKTRITTAELQRYFAGGASALSESEITNPADVARLAAEEHHPIIPINNDRHYLVTDSSGQKIIATLIDSDEVLVGRLSALWQRITLTTTTFRSGDNTVETAERILLMESLAEKFGITPARGTYFSSTSASTLVAFSYLNAAPITDLTPENITDELLDSLWHTLLRAHDKGITHHNIRPSVIGYLVDNDGALGATDTADEATQALITNWRHGSVVSSELSHYIDIAQMLALQTSVAGRERAVAALVRNVPARVVENVAAVVQKAILPVETQRALGDKKAVQQLREAVSEAAPEADSTAAQPIQLRRFSFKTTLTIAIGVVAMGILLGSINFQELKATVSQANPWFIVCAFGAGLLTYVGAALNLKAFIAEKIPLWQASLVQVAASVVGLVMPAGVGPAAINMRYVQKRGVSTPVAVATVSLVQVSQFITTVLLLLFFGLVTGDFGSLSLPSSSVVLGVGIVSAIIAAILMIRPLRQRVWRLLQPTFEQIWPRLVWLATHPMRILVGCIGSIIQTAAFVAAFGFALAAFGHTLPLVPLAITYLISNSVGAMVPSPGGIGPVETALTGGLVIAGIPYSVAFSAAMVFRLATFWLRVPIGWFALRFLQKRNVL